MAVVWNVLVVLVMLGLLPLDSSLIATTCDTESPGLISWSVMGLTAHDTEIHIWNTEEHEI